MIKQMISSMNYRGSSGYVNVAIDFICPFVGLGKYLIGQKEFLIKRALS
jgi:hypothetical protein